MIEVFDKEGNLIENVLTQEEADIQIQTEKEKAIEGANVLRQEEIDNLQIEKDRIETEKAELEIKLAGEGNKEFNFKTLREKTELKDKKIEELSKKIEDLSGVFTKKIDDLSVKQLEETKMELLSALDKNTREKVEFHYKSFTGIPATKEEVRQRIQNATTLATGGRARNTFTGSAVSSVGGIGNIFEEKTGKLENPDATDVARKLGITDEQLKKNNLI